MTILLTKLVRHAPGLRLVKSDLALLSGVSLNLRELDLRSICTELVFVESFLQSNAKSLRSLYIHNIEVTERNRQGTTKLTPAHVRDMIDVTVEREKEA